MKKAMSVMLRVGVSAALIIILLYIMRGKYGQILDALKGADLKVFGLALGAFLGAVALASIRLRLIITAQEIRVSYLETLSLAFIGYFFNNFLPTAIGGDVAKAYYLSKKSADAMSSYVSVFVDRIIGLITMVFMAFVALLFYDNPAIGRKSRYIIYAITAAAILIVIFIFNRNFARKFSWVFALIRPIEEKLRKAYNYIHRYRHYKMLMTQSFLISFVSQALFFISLWTLALCIGSHIILVQIFLMMPIIGVLSLLPSINGLGLRESSTVVLFGPIIGSTNAFAVSILWLAVLFITSVIGGLIYGLSPQFKINLREVKDG